MFNLETVTFYGGEKTTRQGIRYPSFLAELTLEENTYYSVTTRVSATIDWSEISKIRKNLTGFDCLIAVETAVAYMGRTKEQDLFTVISECRERCQTKFATKREIITWADTAINFLHQMRRREFFDGAIRRRISFKFRSMEYNFECLVSSAN